MTVRARVAPTKLLTQALTSAENTLFRIATWKALGDVHDSRDRDSERWVAPDRAKEPQPESEMMNSSDGINWWGKRRKCFKNSSTSIESRVIKRFGEPPSKAAHRFVGSWVRIICAW